MDIDRKTFQDARPGLSALLVALSLGLTTAERSNHLDEALSALGWTSRSWPKWLIDLSHAKGFWGWALGRIAKGLVHTSMAFTPLRTVFISSWAPTGYAKLPLLAHEITHAIKAEEQGRWSWTFDYLVSKRRRLVEESVARAAEIIMRWRLSGGDGAALPFDGLDSDCDGEAEQLCGGGWPYFLKGRNEEASERICLEIRRFQKLQSELAALD